MILTPEYINPFYECCQQLHLSNQLKVKNIIILPFPNGPEQNKKVLNESIINKFKDLNIKIYQYNEIIDLGEKNKYEKKKINPENIAYILNSSGTSQTEIKSICLSHKNVIAVCVIK